MRHIIALMLVLMLSGCTINLGTPASEQTETRVQEPDNQEPTLDQELAGYCNDLDRVLQIYETQPQRAYRLLIETAAEATMFDQHPDLARAASEFMDTPTGSEAEARTMEELGRVSARVCVEHGYEFDAQISGDGLTT